jgi:hypothetical protein
MGVRIATLAVVFLEHWRGGAGGFGDQLRGRNAGGDWPVALWREGIPLALVGHGSPRLECADRRRGLFQKLD